MGAAWFVLIAFMLTVYVVLDGFDFGAGILHRIVAKSDEERRTVLAAIGPFWDGNEVWLIASAGVLVLAFPRAYAVALSGFYLPLMIVLWLLVMRGVSIEFRSREENPLWRSFFDTLFAASSTVLALVLGVALGNLVRGVPLNGSGYFEGPLFTDFRVGPHPGALDWFTLLVGLFSVAVLANHGALYLVWKTRNAVRLRSHRIAGVLSIAVAVLFVPVTIATALVDPVLVHRLAARPWAWGFPAVAIAALVALFIFRRRDRELSGFLASGVFIAALLASTASVLFPTILHSTLGESFDLDAYNAAAGQTSLLVGLVLWIPAVCLALAYVAFLFRSFRGKVVEGADEAHGYSISNPPAP